MREIAPLLQAAQRLANHDDVKAYYVLLTVDFNAPSHMDNGVAWPVSLACEDHGFLDTFRYVYPNCKEVPGITWTPKPEQEKRGCFDRIDFVYVHDNKAHDSLASRGKKWSQKKRKEDEESERDFRVVASFTMDDEHCSWPSDHRAVVTTLELY